MYGNKATYMLFLLISTLLRSYVLQSQEFHLGKAQSPYSLGGKNQLYNQVIHIFEGNEVNDKLRSKALTYIIENPNFFGGACDIYQLYFSQIDGMMNVRVVASKDTYIRDYCKHEQNMTTSMTIKNVSRYALMTKFCFEIFEDESVIDHIKGIMCSSGSCSGENIGLVNVINIYKHFYPYRYINKKNFGLLRDWGVTNTSTSEKEINITARTLGIAFCLDPNWSQF